MFLFAVGVRFRGRINRFYVVASSAARAQLAWEELSRPGDPVYVKPA